MTAPLRRLLVAVVDDDSRVLESLENLLESCDYQTLLFSSAEEFLESPQRKDADLLISDIGLPGISGLDLVRALHAENTGTPIILITAQTEEHLRLEAQRLGISHFHRKPFDGKRLLSSLDDLLGCKPRSDGTF